MGQRLGRMVRGMVATTVVLAVAAATPLGAAGGSSLAVAPTGASSSTVYLAVTNLSLQPSTASLNVSLSSGTTTLVGFTSVSVAPLSTTVVPVRMSGTLTSTMTLNLSSLLTVGVQDTRDPFAF
jgi:hypothetical protein